MSPPCAPWLPARPRVSGRFDAVVAVLQEVAQRVLVEDRHAELLCLGELGTGALPHHDVARLLRHAARDLAFADQVAGNQPGSSVFRHTRTPASIRRARGARRGVVHPQLEVAGRAHLEHDSPLGELLDQCRIFDAAYPVTDPHGVQLFNCLADAVGTFRLAGVRHARQTDGTGASEMFRVRRRRKADLVPTEPERHQSIGASGPVT